MVARHRQGVRIRVVVASNDLWFELGGLSGVMDGNWNNDDWDGRVFGGGFWDDNRRFLGGWCCNLSGGNRSLIEGALQNVLQRSTGGALSDLK